jgi:methionyl-tRNA formyltransferase
MRILFLGSPEEVEAPLLKLHEQGLQHGHELAGVITPPAKPFGRKLQLKDPPIAQISKLLGIKLHQTSNVNSKESITWIRDLGIDVAITAAFGQILSQEFLNIPRRAVINIHPSMLPHYRGATPVQSALLDQKSTTGVTILFTVKALDAGAIILQKSTTIQNEENAPLLVKRLFNMGADILFPALSLLEDPNFKGLEQQLDQVTHCTKIIKTDGLIDWNSKSEEIIAKFKAYYGWPGSYTFMDEKRIKITQMKMVSAKDDPMKSSHSIDAEDNLKPSNFYYSSQLRSIVVTTKNGIIAIEKLQPEGSQPMDAMAFWNGIKKKNITHFDYKMTENT